GEKGRTAPSRTRRLYARRRSRTLATAQRASAEAQSGRRLPGPPLYPKRPMRSLAPGRSRNTTLLLRSSLGEILVASARCVKPHAARRRRRDIPAVADQVETGMRYTEVPPQAALRCYK